MRLGILTLLFLVACEGEAPIVAPPPVGGATEPEATSEPAHADQSTAMAANTTKNGPSACTGNCGCGGMGGMEHCACGMANCTCNAMDGGTDDGGATQIAAALPPPAPALGSIHGNVTTTPRASAANAVIYLEDAPIEPTAKMTATIDNKVMTFSPFVTVVPVGGKVTFHNSDPFPHNVFSPEASGFNIGIIAQHSSNVRIFKKPGAYSLLCNLHPGMLGYLIVSPSSYYAKADSHGAYTLKDVPNGTYKVTAWAPRTQPVTQSLTVKGGDASLDFELHR